MQEQAAYRVNDCSCDESASTSTVKPHCAEAPIFFHLLLSMYVRKIDTNKVGQGAKQAEVRENQSSDMVVFHLRARIAAFINVLSQAPASMNR